MIEVPFRTPEDQSYIEFCQKLFGQECTFLLSVAKLDQLPAPDVPEVAFAGRSNVGKSSLLNGIVAQKNLARASHTPGRTQFLNFFQLGSQLRLVDLPGYGYAEAPKKLIAAWNQLFKFYLKGRVNLKRVYVLIDSRHGVKASDLEMMKMLDETAVSYQLVLTKIDKISDERLVECYHQLKTLAGEHTALHPYILATSSFRHEGLEELRQHISLLADCDESR